MSSDAASPVPASARPAAAGFIVVTVAIDAMGIGLILPVMPELLKAVGGLNVSEAALWGGVLAFSYAFMQFLCSPLLGALSDRHGRRPVLLLSLGALCLDYLVLSVAPALWMLVLARIVAGAAGASFATANAYLADVSPPERRAANFGLVGAGFGVGFVLGPALGGLLGELGPRAPFVAAAALTGVNMLFGWLVLPESLPPERRRPVDWRKADPFSALREVARLPALGPLLWGLGTYALAHSVYPAVWSFYAAAAYGWSPAMIGVSLAAFGVAMAVGQGLLIRVLPRALGARGAIGLGLLTNIVVMLALAWAPGGWVVYAGLPLLAFGIITGPAINGEMSKRVGEEAQGRLQGVVASINGITAILAPLLFTGIFRAATAEGAPVWMPGAPFLVSALLVALAALPLARGLQSKR